VRVNNHDRIQAAIQSAAENSKTTSDASIVKAFGTMAAAGAGKE